MEKALVGARDMGEALARMVPVLAPLRLSLTPTATCRSREPDLRRGRDSRAVPACRPHRATVLPTNVTASAFGAGARAHGESVQAPFSLPFH